MRNIYLITAALASMILASCANEEIVGNEAGTGTTTNGVISFGGTTGNLTRATSNVGTVAEMLDRQMLIYGVKETKTTGKFTAAFQDYVVWSSNTKTETNPDVETTGDRNGWEYVGPTGQSYGTTTTAGTLKFNQTTKYWDYSSAKYHFVAGSPVKAFKYDLDTDGNITSATVSGIGGHINPNPTGGTGTALVSDPVYIADPVIVRKADYKNEVTFNFTRQQTFVRVGIFETIPGYSIQNIEFYTQGTAGWVAPTGDNKNNIILTSTTDKYFSGAEGAEGAKATIRYEWPSEGAPKYNFTYAETGLVQQKNWYGGKLDLSESNPLATTSTESATNVAKLYGSDKDMAATTGYFPVIPMASTATAQPILVKCNYTLLAEDGKGETITVTGATAAIPAAFTLWKPNTTYTYLFKISNNTNGTTGTPGTEDPEGLFPITFDAVVTAEADGTKENIITTVSTPSITTYQEGAITETGIQYKKDKAIYFTAQNDETGELNTLAALTTTPAEGMVQVYSLGTTPKTEADMIVTRPTTTQATTIGAAAWKGIAASKWASFTPTTAGYYAIEYLTKVASGTESAAYAYKIVYVAE